MIDPVTNVYLEDEELQDVLYPLIKAAPKGLASLQALHHSLLEKMLTHPDSVRLIQPTKFFINLPNVDTNGYTVYDKTFTKLYTVFVDYNENPTDDLTVPHLRRMTFGYHTYDSLWLNTLQHGDSFYIGYDSGELMPTLLLVVMLYPTVTGGA
jgi:hypothetical protein